MVWKSAIYRALRQQVLFVYLKMPYSAGLKTEKLNLFLIFHHLNVLVFCQISITII